MEMSEIHKEQSIREDENIERQNNGSHTSDDRCCLSTCGHTCGMCHPILQQLLLLCHKCMSKYEQHPITNTKIVLNNKKDLVNCIKSLLPTIAEDNVTKFRDFVEKEDIPWVKNFILYMAATFGSRDFLQVFVEDINKDNIKSVIEFDSVLNFASGNGKIDCLKYLVECGYDLRVVRQETKETPLHIAAHNGYSECARYLLSEDDEIAFKVPPMIDVNVRSANFSTPLHCAAHNGKDQILEILLRNNADVYLRDAYGDTALHKCVVNGHKECARLLIEAKSDINAQNLGNDTPFRKAVYHGHTECAKMLIENGAEFNSKSDKNISPLHLAVFKGHTDCASLLIEHGADVDVADESGMTPLYFAAVNGHKYCVKLLIEKGANVNFKDHEKKTPLHTASRKGFHPCCKILCENGSHVNAVDLAEWTPLHEATSEGSSECVSLLIEYGAIVNCPDKDGCHPIHLASRCGHFDCLQLLLLRGSKVDVKDKAGWTPLHEAANEGNSTSLDLLLKAASIEKNRDPSAFKMLIDSQEEDGNTALHKAADSGDFNCIKLLIEYGASLVIKNKARLIPSDLCSDSECQQYFTLKLLQMNHNSGENYVEEEEDEIIDEQFLIDNKDIFLPRENFESNVTERLQSIEEIIERVVSLSEKSKKEENVIEDSNHSINDGTIKKEITKKSKKKKKNGNNKMTLENTKPFGFENMKHTKQTSKQKEIEKLEKEVQNSIVPLKIKEIPNELSKEDEKDKLIFNFQLKAAQEAIVTMEEDLEKERLHSHQLQIKLDAEIKEKDQVSLFLENVLINRIDSIENKLSELEQNCNIPKNDNCLSCNENLREILFLPCLHFLYCENCFNNQKPNQCSKCSMSIKGSLKTER